MPRMSHRAAFLIKDPTGSHANSRKYVRLTAASRGTRHTKRNTWKGSAIPEASGDTGKNGAMPDPVRAVRVRPYTKNGTWGSGNVPRSLYCEYFSMCSGGAGRYLSMEGAGG